MLVVVGLFVMPLYAYAGEIHADHLQRDVYGEVFASGQVQLKTKDFELEADKVIVDLDSKAGDIYDGTIYFEEGYTLQGEHLKRIDLNQFYGKDVLFTSCPEDERAWLIRADEATLDREKGEFVATNARFEWGGIPVFYTPRWSHALSRRSGFLMPQMRQSDKRGVEFVAPFYWAGAPNWDVTLSPHWMSKRGLMSDVEWRHRSKVGKESIQIRSVYDEQNGVQRSRLLTDMAWSPTQSVRAHLKIDAVDDGLHVSDFPLFQELESKAYLASTAAVTWQGGKDNITLSSRYQQRLGGASNDATLQEMPRVQSMQYFDIGEQQALQLEHQTTVFQRIKGVQGKRVAIKPVWSMPWDMESGAVSAKWTVLGQFVGYETEAFNATSSFYAAFASSMELQAAFERVFSDKQWRHEIKPILRVDVSTVPEQNKLPSYDSNLIPLSMSNVMRGSRYSGWDRFERMRRASFVLESLLQNKTEEGDARTVFQSRMGIVWDTLQETVDVAKVAAPTRTVSNFLAELSWLPVSNLNLSTGGQRDPDLAVWVESHASVRWFSPYHNVDVSWQKTDASHSRETESINTNVRVNLGSYWSSYAVIQKDMFRGQVINKKLGISYEHACWDVALEQFETYQVGSDGLTNIGFSLLLAFDGLGSFGSGAN